MANCLVTKLKENVTNNNLIEIGTRNILLKGGIEKGIISTIDHSPFKIKVLEGGHLIINGIEYTEYTANSGSLSFNTVLDPGSSIIKANISNWYKIAAMENLSDNCAIYTADLKYSSITYLVWVTLEGQFIDLQGKEMITFYINNYGNAANLYFTEAEAISTISSWPLRNFSSRYGNVFGLSDINLGRALPQTIENIVITDADFGAMENFIAGHRENRLSGSMVFDISANAISFNGSYLSEGKHNVSFTENTITCDGVTINA